MKVTIPLRPILLTAGLALVVPAFTGAQAPKAPPRDAPWVVGLEELHRLDLLPAFKRSVKIGAVTSYDRTEGNDDGFSGKYSFVRREGDNLVLADLQGPGCIYRIHTPTPTDDLVEFFFDGEEKPRLSLPLRKLFTGEVAPFVRPLVDGAGGGFYSYVPIPYRKSCKIVLHAKQFQFYDLNYATYPADAPVTTFDPAVSSADRKGLDQAKAVFSGGRASDLTAFNVPEGTHLRRQPFSVDLKPGKSAVLFKTSRAGRIASLRLGPAAAFMSKRRDILLRITWDDARIPAVLCPAGDFFGYAWGKPATGSALIGTYSGVNYCNLPMPFDKAAKIELVSLREDGPAVSIGGEVVVGDTPRRPYEGKFYAVWRRENPTTEGKPFTFLDTQGRGHLVGLALQAQGKESGTTGFFEGDDQTTVDGELVVHGTGSEDFFNGGWYEVPGRWDRPVARPMSGCMAYQKHLSRTGGYRFMVGDAYSFRRSLRQTIEHAPVENKMPADYCAVAYFYSESPPTVEMTVPTLAQREVVDPTTMPFNAHWALPISSFALNGATVSRRSVPSGNGETRVLSLRAKGEDFFGPPFVSLVCELPAAGKYKVYVDVVKGPEQGIVQLFQDETAVGGAIDLYAEKPEVANRVYLGEISATEGANDLMFKLVGKNAGSKALGFDLINIVCVRSL
jgi:hypothetical protein